MCVGDRPGLVTGCGLYRVHLPAQQMRAAGWDVDVTGSAVGRFRLLSNGLSECWETRPEDYPYDLVVFQRPAGFSVSTLVRQVAKHTPVAVELDDDLERVDALNAAYRNVHPQHSPDENWHHLKDACRAADLVTVTTPALLRYAPPGRGAVLPNYIPRILIGSQRAYDWTDGQPRVGWSGQVSTHPTDLQVTHGGVGRALAATGTPFHVVGSSEMVRVFLGIPDGVEVTESGWQPISDYPDHLTAIDVGIVPLADSTFNDAKSCLKGLEFAALGIPFVASPTPEYRRLHDEFGIGLLAKRPRDWERHVTALVNDEGMRRELGQAWRVKVADNLTCETNGWRWMRAYEKAAARGVARVKAASTVGR